MTDLVCLVTGGAGFIGCSIAPYLVERYRTVICLDSLHSQVHSLRSRPSALHPRVQFIHGDTTDRDLWGDLLAQVTPDVVIHLAAETGTGQSLTESERHAHANVVGTACMLDSFVKRSRFPRTILLASSRAVYGEGQWQDETEVVYPGQRSRLQLERGNWDFPGLKALVSEAGRTEPRPISAYGATKLTQEHLIGLWARSFGVDAIILRLQNVFGPGQSLSNRYTGIVSLFSQLAKDRKSIPVYEDGNIVRDFVYIADVAAAFGAALEVSTTPRTTNVYDIGSGRPRTILEVANWLATHYGAPMPVVNGDFRHGDVRHAWCDISRSAEELHWTPEWSLERGLSEFCAWIDSQHEAIG